MCVIAYLKTRQMTRKEFDNCWDGNSDGFGMAWRESKGVTAFKKGIMDVETAWSEYGKIKDKKNITLHFRIKTAGAVCPELTHPFLVTGDSPTVLSHVGRENVLFHNGCLTRWEDELIEYMLDAKMPRVTGDMSDTRWAAIKMSTLPEESRSDALVKENGKFVIYTTDTVWLVGDFIDEKGILFSNRSFEEDRWVNYRKAQKYNKKNGDKWWEKVQPRQTSRGRRGSSAFQEEIDKYGALFNDPFYRGGYNGD